MLKTANVIRERLARSAMIVLLSMGCGTTLLGDPGHAGDQTVGHIKINQAWSRATPRGAPVGAGYVTIHNMGTAPDRLVSGTTDIAERVEIHSMEMTGGVMKMRRLSAGLEIPPGKSVTFKPGSYHIMFMKLKKPIEKGQTFKATLVFEKAGAADVMFTAAGIGAQGLHGAGAHGKHGQMKHMKKTPK
ncbi:MAG: copper chaperone PCu(A)C [Hyphomicrobiaceae bacterium]